MLDLLRVMAEEAVIPEPRPDLGQEPHGSDQKHDNMTMKTDMHRNARLHVLIDIHPSSMHARMNTCMLHCFT